MRALASLASKSRGRSRSAPVVFALAGLFVVLMLALAALAGHGGNSRRKVDEPAPNEGNLYRTYSHIIHRMRLLLLALGGGVLLVAIAMAPKAIDSLQGGGFLDPGTESSQATTVLVDRLGVGGRDIVALYHSDRYTVDDEEFVKSVSHALERASKDPAVSGIISYYGLGDPALVSKDGRYTFAVVTLRGDEDRKIEAFPRLKQALQAPALSTQLGGELAYLEAADRLSEKDLRRAEMLALPLIAVLLIYVFRSLVASFLAILIGVLNILTALLMLAGLSQFMDVTTLVLTPITMLGLGLAVDYSLLIISRFREEMGRSGEGQTALARTLGTAGKTVAISGLIVSVSVLGLLLFPALFLRSLGLGAVLVVLSAMAWSLTLLPALLDYLGPRVNRLRLPWVSEAQVGTGAWAQISRLVMKRPVPVLLGSLALLVLIAWPAKDFHAQSQNRREFPRAEEVRQVQDTLDSPDHFESGNTELLVLAVRSNGDILGTDNQKQLTDYVGQVEALGGVKRVASVLDSPQAVAGAIAGPAGTPAEAGQAHAFPQETDERESAETPAASSLVHGDTTMVTVSTDLDPFSKEARDLVNQVRQLKPEGLEVKVGGDTARLIDEQDGNLRALPLAIAVMAGAVLLLLFLFFGSVVVPIKAVILNILSLGAAYGFLVWGFQHGHLASLLGFQSVGGIDITVPLLLLPFMFGLTMDYEVFLLGRVREEYDRTKNNVLSVGLGLQHTGRIITGAAVVLIVVCAAFGTSDFIYIKEIGVTLAFALALDAIIVRALLMPAAMRLLGNLNWWAPQPLTALRRRMMGAAPAQRQ